jgi:hypothetical protein
MIKVRLFEKDAEISVLLIESVDFLDLGEAAPPHELLTGMSKMLNSFSFELDAR